MANAQKVMTLADTAQLIAKVHKNAAQAILLRLHQGRIRQHRRLLHRPHGRQDIRREIPQIHVQQHPGRREDP